MKYNIIRVYSEADKPSKVIKRNVTLEEARTHCNDPATREAGVSFDGYGDAQRVSQTN